MNYDPCLVPIKALPHNISVPQYKPEQAAAADAYAAIPEPVTIAPGETKKIPLGFAAKVPEGYALVVLSRSGLASRGIQIANCPGIVDPDYRGEICALVYNGNFRTNDVCANCAEEECKTCLFAKQKPVCISTDDAFVVNPGDRICQVGLIPMLHMSFKLVDELPETRRGSSGFGSTGI